MSRGSSDPRQIDEWLAGVDWPQAVRWTLVATVVLLVAWGTLTSFYTVQPEGEAVVKRFGKVVAIKQPGLHFKLPFGIDTQTFVPTARVLKEEFGFRTAVQSGKGGHR